VTGRGISSERLAWHNKGLADGRRGERKPPDEDAARKAYMTGWSTGNAERQKEAGA
jgi:hypothetical protein